MGEQEVIDIGIGAITIAVKIAAPALVAMMVTGLIVSIFQAATQINEQTLSFIPKIIAMTVALVLTGSWILKLIMVYTTDIIESIATVAH